MTTIPLVATHPHQCSYLSHEMAQTAFVHPGFPISTFLYNLLIAQGFRRSGDDVYQNICTHCAACLPSRVHTSQFAPNRSQRRCLAKNQDIQISIRPAEFEQQHYDLYIDYQKHKHADGNMQHSTPDEYLQFLSSRWCDTRFVEFRLQQTLIAVAVVDFLPDALSAVYTFFHPDYAYLSPGTYAVLWQIQHAQQLNLQWVYLGYWIADCRKMRYKTQFQPMQILEHGLWRDFQQLNSE